MQSNLCKDCIKTSPQSKPVTGRRKTEASGEVDKEPVRIFSNFHFMMLNALPIDEPSLEFKYFCLDDSIVYYRFCKLRGPPAAF